MENTKLELNETEATPVEVQEEGKTTFSEKMKNFFKNLGPFFKKCWHSFTHMKRKTIVDIIVWILLALGAVVVLFPFIWMVFSTFKEPTEVYGTNIFPKKWTGQNYAEMWESVNLLRGFLNSFLTTVPVVLVQVVVSAMAAYAFAKLSFKGKNVLFLIMLSTMMIPFAVVMLPQLWLYGRIGLTEVDILAVMIPKLFGSVTTVFFLRQFLYGIPKSISEAALLDGAGYTRIFISIILPLIMPALATQFILSFIGNWNDYLGPMLFITDPDWFTLPLMVKSINKDPQGLTGAFPTLAASLVSLIPIIVVFAVFQKKIIGSIVFSAVKG